MSSIGNLAGGSPDLATYLQHHKQGPAAKLFAKIDSDGDGKISKTELEAAFTAAGGSTDQADALFDKLDKDGDGAVSKTEFLTAAARGHRQAHMAQGGGADASQVAPPTTQVQNQDGSITITITASDGSKIAFTTPVPAEPVPPQPAQGAQGDPSGPSKVSIVV
jgi:hypothetical protein